MQLDRCYVPYGGYWSTPFCKWQGSFSTLHPIPFAAQTVARALGERGVPPDAFDGMCLGTTVPSRGAFYGAPWLAGLAGLTGATGPNIAQPCPTSVRCLVHGAEELASGGCRTFLVVAADRTSNGPHIYYPDPSAPGGTGEKEDWVLDNFGHDPFAKNAMIETAENVARSAGIDRAAQDEVALLRYEQYRKALADDRAFQKRYMVAPIEIRNPRGKVVATVETDEGVFPTTAEALAKLKPVAKDGTVTFGSQTFPADGSAAMILTSRDRARELSRDGRVEIRLVSYAQARVRKGFMPAANVPASRLALSRAGIDFHDLAAITSHTPFAVNDVYFARETGVKLEDMNRFGCSLIWGHPQAPTGLRSVIELIEELALSGGGYGLFTGCAAGDTAAALVIEVTAK